MGPGDLLGLGLPAGGELIGFLWDSRRPIEVGSMNLVEFLSRHVNATRGRVILGMEEFMWVRRHVMLVGSSRGVRLPRFLTTIISDAGILEQGEVVDIPHGGSRSGGGEANELLHGLNHPC